MKKQKQQTRRNPAKEFVTGVFRGTAGPGLVLCSAEDGNYHNVHAYDGRPRLNINVPITRAVFDALYKAMSDMEMTDE